ncbi:HET-domain-containing protein [Polychaeton citri CBS 116435]|uniref:HET-domain-containing protein n=1 Tax=Polychaeton citri CBS 116435 TaxID=1314669 RepID=A0A9P4UTB4_9PEZI|nr:HET-domain-containing protein [Polychaeton citri CBS 116435]
MRLIRIRAGGARSERLELEDFIGDNIPPYAILSHTWTEQEVLFEDVKAGQAHTKTAYRKVLFAIDQAQKDGLDYLWIDTCCIDKSSSSDLQEAINSMYSWYEHAHVCYVYLEDVQVSHESTQGYKGVSRLDIERSRWFTRGWTLQELLAPTLLQFYTYDWDGFAVVEKGRRAEPRYIPARHHTYRSKSKSHEGFVEVLSEITGIHCRYLDGSLAIRKASIAARMHWASTRTTTRVEDLAYCLMGIFDVNMPLLYGEGAKAFQRLQEEIMKQTDDTSIFAWTNEAGGEDDFHGLLADRPSLFESRRQIRRAARRRQMPPYGPTNQGLQIQLPLKSLGDNLYMAVLDCGDFGEAWNAAADSFYAIYVKRLGTRSNQFSRVLCNRLYSVAAAELADCTSELLYFSQRVGPDDCDTELPTHLQLQVSFDEDSLSVIYSRLGPETRPIRQGDQRLEVDTPAHVTVGSHSKNTKSYLLATERLDTTALTVTHQELGYQMLIAFGVLGGHIIGYDAIWLGQSRQSRHLTVDLKRLGRRVDFEPLGVHNIAEGPFSCKVSISGISVRQLDLYKGRYSVEKHMEVSIDISCDRKSPSSAAGAQTERANAAHSLLRKSTADFNLRARARHDSALLKPYHDSGLGIKGLVDNESDLLLAPTQEE